MMASPIPAIGSTWRFSTSWHVSVAAESITAALFAQCGYDVSVQYGANQPQYDLIVAKGKRLLKISVKGSQDGGWGLSQSFYEEGLSRLSWCHQVLDRSPQVANCPLLRPVPRCQAN